MEQFRYYTQDELYTGKFLMKNSLGQVKSVRVFRDGKVFYCNDSHQTKATSVLLKPIIE